MQQGQFHTLPAACGLSNLVADMHTPRRCGLFWDCVHVPWALDPPPAAPQVRCFSALTPTLATFLRQPLFATFLAAATIRAAVDHDCRPARATACARPRQNDVSLPAAAHVCALSTRRNARAVAGKNALHSMRRVCRLTATLSIKALRLTSFRSPAMRGQLVSLGSE